MAVPILLLLLSLAGVAVALLIPGYGDLILLAGPSAVAAFILWLRAALPRREGRGTSSRHAAGGQCGLHVPVPHRLPR